MRIILALLSVVALVQARPAEAQEFRFERSFDVTGQAILDVSIVRGKIDIVAGPPDRIVVTGIVTVRFGWDVPVNAVELAKNVAANPPIQRDGQTVKVRPPSAPDEQRAVTVAYTIQVPATTQVMTVTESGATTIRGVTGSVVVRTQSAAIELTDLGASAEVRTGSGAVTADRVAGPLNVTTSSSAFTGRALGGHVRVRTNSGSIDAVVAGSGDVDVETSSSAIRVEGARGALTAKTESGHMTLSGVPSRPWTVSSGSSGFDVAIYSNASFSVEAHSESGSASLDGATVRGTTSKGHLSGDVGSGGPLVRLNSRSGSIKVRVGR